MSKTAVLTGQFLSDIESVEDILKKYKIETVREIQEDTTLLVIGEGTKSYWASSPTGTLIHEATRRSLNGSEIEVLYEKEFLRKFNPKTPTDEIHV